MAPYFRNRDKKRSRLKMFGTTRRNTQKQDNPREKWEVWSPMFRNLKTYEY